MSIPEEPADNSKCYNSPSAKPSRSRWERFGLPALILVLLCALVVLEGIGYVCQSQSVERIKAWVRSLPPDSEIRLAELEARLNGSPRRKTFEHQGSLRIIYTWSSVIGTYRLRAQVRQDGRIVYVDTEPQEAEDFMTPFLVANEDGVRVVVPGEAPPAHKPREMQIDEWAEVRAQFAQPKATLPPGLVVFPVSDEQRAITTTGPALSMTAQYSLGFTPRRRTALSPRLVQQVLTDDACWLPGTILDQAKIDNCLKATGAAAYALPHIEERDGKWSIQIEVCRSGGEETAKLNRQAKTLALVPGEIALGLFEHLKIQLSADEKKNVATPQFQQSTDAEAYTRMVLGTQMTAERAAEFHKQLLEQNPEWIAAWHYYLDQAGITVSVPQLPEIRQHPVLARSQYTVIQPKVGFVKLLMMAPSLRGDADFHEALVILADRMTDEKLVNEMVRIWKVEDNSYASRVARAQTLAMLGWAALPNDGVTTTTPATYPKARELFQQAQVDLDQALVLNPQGADAHTELIQVAQGLGQPWPIIQAHLETALLLRPGNRLAWQYVDRTTGRLGPQNAANAYQFAELCLAHGKWFEVPDILRGAAFDPDKRTLVFEQFQAPEHWRLIQQYFRVAQEQPLDAGHLRMVRACFAHDAALSGHYAEAAPVFDQLDLPFVPPALPPGVSPSAADPVIYRFEGQSRYIQLRDKVRAQTQTGVAAKLSAARIALTESRLSDAEQILLDATTTTDDEAAELARLRRALAFGQRLAKERRVELTVQEAFELFASVSQQGYRGLNRISEWQVNGSELIRKYGGQRPKSNDELQSTIYFPVGLRHGTITGKLSYQGACLSMHLIAHAQAFRKPLALQYHCMKPGKVILQGAGGQTEKGMLKEGPCGFKLQYGATTDLLSPTPDYQWKVPVVDDSPSTFGLRVAWSNETPASVSLSDLVIELGE